MLGFVGEHPRSSRATVLCSGWGRVVSAPDPGTTRPNLALAVTEAISSLPGGPPQSPSVCLLVSATRPLDLRRNV